jgi:hypothetical protein
MEHEMEITSITINTIIKNIQQTYKHSECCNAKKCIRVKMTCCLYLFILSDHITLQQEVQYM